VINPANGSVLARVRHAGARETVEAIAHADVAQYGWRQRTGRERATVLMAWKRRLEEAADDLATVMTLGLCPRSPRQPGLI
jgi:succinate-semialdehyde dehydrogenase / glutarate-semialdehyde dehydrogenase